MPITNISIENFKGIGKRVDIPIRPITLLFGANSSGKSTILQALLYLRHVLENREPIKVNADKLEVSGESIDLGGFSQFVHNHDENKEVIIGVSATVGDDGLKGYCDTKSDDISLPIKGINEVTVKVGIAQASSALGSFIFVKEYEVDFNGQLLARVVSNASQTQVLLTLEKEHPIFDGKILDEDQVKVDLGLSETPFPILTYYEELKKKKEDKEVWLPPKTLCIPKWGQSFLKISKELAFDTGFDEATYQLNQILVGSGELILKELQEIRHLFGIRELPQRSFKPRITHDQSRWANGLAAWDLLYAEKKETLEPTIKAINQLGLSCTFKVQDFYKIPYDSSHIGLIPLTKIGEGDYSVTDDFLEGCDKELEKAEVVRELILSDGKAKLQINDVGLGVSQVLPIVVGAYDRGFSIMSVEQPELHIHPAVQCKLADVLAHALLGKKKDDEKYLLLETHSEHLMLRLLRRIREKYEEELPPGAPEIEPNDLSVLYVEKDDEGVKITHIPVTDDGDFEKKWPKGFFEERTEELF